MGSSCKLKQGMANVRPEFKFYSTILSYGNVTSGESQSNSTGLLRSKGHDACVTLLLFFFSNKHNF